MKKSNKILLQALKMVKHKISWEGFDYCFKCYSNWEEVKDDEFHRLRSGYENGIISRKELENYINTKIISLDELLTK